MFLNRLAFSWLKIGPRSALRGELPNGVPKMRAEPGALRMYLTSLGVTETIPWPALSAVRPMKPFTLVTVLMRPKRKAST